MKSIKLDFEYCYGIGSLQKTFNLEDNGCIIYSKNGTMKSSFAKTFEQLSLGREPEDRIYPERISKFEVTKDDGTIIQADEILVINPFDDNMFKDYRDISLLAENELRKNYLEAYKEIDECKKEFLKALALKSGITRNIEDIFLEFFKGEFFEILININNNLDEFNHSNYQGFPEYNKIFDKKGINDLEKSVDMKLLNDYMEKYNMLLEDSKYLKKGILNHNNINNISGALDTNGFFEAGHFINLTNKESKQLISNKNDLDKLIDEEKNLILNNKELRDLFDKIDKALIKNANTRNLRSLFEENPDIVPYYTDVESFKKDMWYTYLKQEEEKLKELLDVYLENSKILEKIINEAREQETEWNKVLEIFKTRFSVPFDIEIENKSDVILSREKPSLKFKYNCCQTNETKEINRDKLLECLSRGESRALYLLDIIFKIRSLEDSEKDILLIIDDIADSFDYRNKYAIIEYLRDIKSTGLFKMIILTHNFDFYRTVANRLQFERKNRFMTIVNERKITFTEGNFVKNLFNSWKDQMAKNKRIMVAAIPFVRNLVEYLEDINNGNSANYNLLTSILHIKEDTNTIQIKDLERVFNDVWKVNKDLEYRDEPDKIIDIIFKLADEIMNENHTIINLENKIILSIASRLYAEKYMGNEISQEGGKIYYDSRQTFRLMEKYKEYFPDKSDNIQLLGEINMMTAENIHINSFMYEPILDMSDEYLKKIYKNAKDLVEVRTSSISN